MNNMPNIGEIAVKKAEENQTRKILEIIRDCKDEGKDLEEAEKRIKVLLEE